MRAAVFATMLALGGCAVVNEVSNVPLTPAVPRGMGAPDGIASANAIALSFSGGGLRASAFAHGVLQALAETGTEGGNLLDDVILIGSVSGGSLTAAYFGLNGEEGLGRFRDEVLLQDFESAMNLTPWMPWNMARALGGGLNLRENFADTLDRDVFRGATFADLFRRGKPEIRIHATDLYHRVVFPFTPQNFTLICSDLSRYRVADAVAASAAVPVIFAPVLLRSYPANCNDPLPPSLDRVRFDPDSPLLAKAAEAAIRAYRDPEGVRYIKLADGGLSDNFGLSSLMLSRIVRGQPFAPLSERDAVRIRRLLFIVVDASRSPNGDWGKRAEGPLGMDLAVSATDAAVDSTARLAADAFGQAIREWQDAVVDFRCRLPLGRVEELGGPSPWHCSDVKFSLAFVSADRLDDAELRQAFEAIPTRLALSPREIDLAIEAGRRVTHALPRLHRYVHERIPAVAVR